VKNLILGLTGQISVTELNIKLDFVPVTLLKTNRIKQFLMVMIHHLIIIWEPVNQKLTRLGHISTLTVLSTIQMMHLKHMGLLQVILFLKPLLMSPLKGVMKISSLNGVKIAQLTLQNGKFNVQVIHCLKTMWLH
jgi:hypothetical protein